METRKVYPEALIKVCQKYIDNHASYFGKGRTLKRIAEQIILFFDKQPKDVSQTYLSLMSYCFIYALQIILKNLNSNNFARFINDEFFEDFSHLNYQPKGIQKIVGILTKMLTNNEYDISTDLDTTPIKLLALKRAIRSGFIKFDDNPELEKYLLELHSLEIRKNCSYNDAIKLIGFICTAIIKTENFHFLKEFADKFYKEENTNTLLQPIGTGVTDFWQNLLFKKAFNEALGFEPRQISYGKTLFYSSAKNKEKVPTLTFKLLDYADQIHDHVTLFDFWEYVGNSAISINNTELIQKIMEKQKNQKPDRQYIKDYFDKIWTIPVLAYAVENNAIEITQLIMDECGKDLLLLVPPQEFSLYKNHDAGILNAAIITDSFDLLKSWVKQFLAKDYGKYNADHQIEHAMIAKTVEHGKHHMLEWLLNESGIMINDKILYEAAKSCLGIRLKTSKDWEIIRLIYNDQRFNPDYCIKEGSRFGTNAKKEYIQPPLINISMKANCDEFSIMLLQHPNLNLENIKNYFFVEFIQEEKFNLISCLMYNSRFFAMEKNWLDWSKKNLNSTPPNEKIIQEITETSKSFSDMRQRITTGIINRLPANIFTEIAKVFHCWHSLKQIDAKFLELGLPIEILKLIKQTLFQSFVFNPSVTAIVSHGLFSIKSTAENKDCEISLKSKRIQL